MVGNRYRATLYVNHMYGNTPVGVPGAVKVAPTDGGVVWPPGPFPAEIGGVVAAEDELPDEPTMVGIVPDEVTLSCT